MKRTTIEIKDIKIRGSWKRNGINNEKLAEREEFYNSTGEFKSEVFINRGNYLIDGYTTYVIARRKGLKYITVILVEDIEKKHAYKYIKNKIENLEDELLNRTYGIFNKIKLNLKIRVLKDIKEEMFKNENI